MQETYHYIGLDIHKRTVSFCEKRADGKTVDAGAFGELYASYPFSPPPRHNAA